MNQVLIFRAPAAVRVTVNDDKSALCDKRDTITICLDEERPANLCLSFDWDVDPIDLAARYKLNEKEGAVDVFYENDAGQRVVYTPKHGWIQGDVGV